VKSIYSDHRERLVKETEKIAFAVQEKGLYLIHVQAKTKNEKQMGGTDDEDLRIEIDNRKFPQLTNSERYFDSPAAFSGGTSKGLTKSVFFLLWLEPGEHHFSLIPDLSATFIGVDVFLLTQESTVPELSLPLNSTAEDGDRRDWITFVLVDASLGSFNIELTLIRRFLDNDDVKIVINDSLKRGHQNKRQKLWYFVASLLKGEQQSEKFETNLPSDVHYLEFGADRMPKFEKITFADLSFKIPLTIQEKIEYRAKQYGFDPQMMLRLAKRESQFDPKAISGMGAKGLFQLTDITIKDLAQHGFTITDPFDIDQNIEGGFLYFYRLYKRYEGKKDQIQMTLAAWSRGPSRVPVDEPLDWTGMPDETKNLINDVLGDYDF